MNLLARTIRLVGLSACVVLATGAFAAAAAAVQPGLTEAGALRFSRIVAFGDSLSSGGRGKSGPSTGPAPTEANGNFPRLTWVQQLSTMAGLGTLVKWEEGGSNYAIGGTTSAQVADQVTRYLKTRRGQADSAALHTIWSGSNDLTHELRDRYKQDGVLSLFGMEKALVASAAHAADRLETEIDRLARAGAVHIVWINLPDLSRTPSLAARTASFPALAGVAERAFRDACESFNARLVLAAARLRSAYPGLDLVELDSALFFARVMANPDAYNFTDVKNPSRTSNQHLFYDNAHPTAHGHHEFARYVCGQLVALGRLPSP